MEEVKECYVAGRAEASERGTLSEAVPVRETDGVESTCAVQSLHTYLVFILSLRGLLSSLLSICLSTLTLIITATPIFYQLQ